MSPLMNTKTVEIWLPFQQGLMQQDIKRASFAKLDLLTIGIDLDSQ